MEDREKKALDVLKKLDIKYDYYAHEPHFTIEAAKELDEKMGISICKNLFLSTRHSTEFYLLFMRGDKKFNTGVVSKQLSVPRLTFGKDELLLEFLDVYPGSVCPLGLINDIENKVGFLIDKDVLEMEKVSMHPCVNTATIVISTKDLIEKLLPYCNRGYREVMV
ncbi:MAG: prolyl-tRNA synthetase associated domain-containing protein [Lachnospiraceae bacterium]|nr:prolyl-tRNA synthetase associated domain-containing protein [Lachnospiraceae bacterium]